MKKISKTEAEKKIKDFFKDIREKSPKEIKKIKRFAMNNNIPLKNLRKKFCKKCLSPYSGKEKVRINNKTKSIVCKNCNHANRWKIKS